MKLVKEMKQYELDEKDLQEIFHVEDATIYTSFDEYHIGIEQPIYISQYEDEEGEVFIDDVLNKIAKYVHYQLCSSLEFNENNYEVMLQSSDSSLFRSNLPTKVVVNVIGQPSPELDKNKLEKALNEMGYDVSFHSTEPGLHLSNGQFVNWDELKKEMNQLFEGK